ncbi:Uncharacterised protein [Mycoplasmopsis maculosa]|uniref:Uncharacterized protein n=1 Tax=Mycoplasmopsis maculosa TaxID=114885 RepID=A0A449B5C6_9BACT|nr:hypothetical protein [Mycoplasmopsis maculosa]VEU75800.1 Uncharacterised protein [Mycoplasmopsis maculosa]
MIFSIEIWTFIIWALNLIINPLIFISLIYLILGFNNFIKILDLIIFPYRIKNNLQSSSKKINYSFKKIIKFSWLWFTFLSILSLTSSIIYLVFGLKKMYGNVSELTLQFFLIISSFGILLVITYLILQINLHNNYLKFVKNYDFKYNELNYKNDEKINKEKLPLFIKINLENSLKLKRLIWFIPFIPLFFSLFKKNNEFKISFKHALLFIDFDLIKSESINNDIWKSYISKF